MICRKCRAFYNGKCDINAPKSRRKKTKKGLDGCTLTSLDIDCRIWRLDLTNRLKEKERNEKILTECQKYKVRPTLAQISLAAKEQKMTYGEYVRRHGL